MATQQSFDFASKRDTCSSNHRIPIDESFPEDEVEQLVRNESFNKHLYRPNTYLHKWWARRSGVTFRAICKQLVKDPQHSDYYSAGGLEGKVILDPMMGGGTTLHEAIRMGANCIGVDVDPIPVLQLVGSLTMPNSHELIKAFDEFYYQTASSLIHLYRSSCPICDQNSDVQYVLYGAKKYCDCGEALFVDTYLLREEPNGANIYICPNCGEVYSNDIHQCDSSQENRILEKGARKCSACEQHFKDRVDLPFAMRYEPIAIVLNCDNHGQIFKSSDAHDNKLMKQASELSQSLFTDKADFEVLPGPKSNDLLNRNIKFYIELFTPRQLLYLSSAIDVIGGMPTAHQRWLSLLVSTSLEFNSILCGYKGAGKRRPGAIRHVFSHHAYSFPYTALENNPLFPKATSGTLRRLFNDRILRAKQWSDSPIERRIVKGKTLKVRIDGETDSGKAVKSYDELRLGEQRFMAMQKDSRNLNIPYGLVDFVITDPPYYDNVQYSDLSRFFRVWLREMLPDHKEWDYDHANSAVASGDEEASRYGDLLAGIWQVCHDVLDTEDGRLIFTFHHWQPEAWAELTLSLRRANFRLVNRFVVLSENPISVHIRSLKSIKHDTILVCKPNRDSYLESKWTEVSDINKDCSYQFCKDCGTALGWLLDSSLTEDQIREYWSSLLEGKDG